MALGTTVIADSVLMDCIASSTSVLARFAMGSSNCLISAASWLAFKKGFLVASAYHSENCAPLQTVGDHGNGEDTVQVAEEFLLHQEPQL